MLQAAYIVVHGSGTRYLTHREWKDTVSLALIPLPVLACCSEYLPPGYQSCVKEGPVPGYQYSGRNDSESNASMDGLPSKFHSITSHTASLALFTNAGDGLYEWLVRKYR